MGRSGPHTAALIRAQHLVAVPTVSALSTRGLDSAPLPPPLLDAATRLLELTDTMPARKDHSS